MAKDRLGSLRWYPRVQRQESRVVVLDGIALAACVASLQRTPFFSRPIARLSLPLFLFLLLTTLTDSVRHGTKDESGLQPVIWFPTSLQSGSYIFSNVKAAVQNSEWLKKCPTYLGRPMRFAHCCRVICIWYEGSDVRKLLCTWGKNIEIGRGRRGAGDMVGICCSLGH